MTAPAPHVLVADDRIENRELIAAILEDEGYRITAAANGRQALKLARGEPPDAILLDVAMPDIDGFAVCRQLQQHAETALVPVIFVSAQVLDKPSVCHGLTLGAIDYITKPFDPDELAARVRNALRMKAQNERLRLMALTDPLTGLGNRHTLNSRLQTCLARWRRRDEPFGLLVIDVDHFKRVNDVHGHEIGDRVLQRLADLLREMARAEDTVGRLGGEEFLILLDHAGRQEAVQAAERLRRRAERLTVPAQDGTAITFTISIGVVSSADLDRNAASKAALRYADSALYVAKETGRNRVIYYPNLPAARVLAAATAEARPLAPV